MSKAKKEETPDSKDDTLWKTFNLNTCAATSTSVDLAGLTFNLDVTGACTAGTLPPSHDEKIEQLLTDIWHNQATIIKWLEKIARHTKPSV